ncbi:uncharacterized protein Dwil_GK19335 [Drosophila willistoni]|uniref:DUF4794 domain-containing protein n=1 Tax=Drosophila willistoni TaxID=7260 RepID=B4MNY4_DROWI|nr:uncharacterized protein LOC6639818 [Drosophila willistoni]EDW73823.1 uncharacterized protein Dwil_GK19335 [Drosophila willistoni]
MKSVIVFILVLGSVLAAPPTRVIGAKPQVDPYAHIFAQVRPAGQKHEEIHNHFSIEYNAEQPETQLIELEIKPSEEQKHSQLIELNLTADDDRKLSNGIGLEIVQHEHQNHVEIKKPEHHHVELDIIPSDVHAHSERLELELTADKRPSQEIASEVVQHPQAQNHHIVDIEIKEPEYHHVELDINPSEVHALTADRLPSIEIVQHKPVQHMPQPLHLVQAHI